MNLLIVTHCHADHIGCLPRMVEAGDLTADVALVADEYLGFGRTFDGAEPDAVDDLSSSALRVLAALREESRVDSSDEALRAFLQDAVTLEQRYTRMLQRLATRGTRVVRYGRDDHSVVEEAFAEVELKILGPSIEQLLTCAELLQREQGGDAAVLARLSDAGTEELASYRALVEERLSDGEPLADRVARGAVINNQSIVVRLGPPGRRVLLTGDLQFARSEVPSIDEEIGDLLERVLADAPYKFVKTAHHTAENGFDIATLEALAPAVVVHTGGSDDPKHPNAKVLAQLRQADAAFKFARTDRNGRVRFDGDSVTVERGRVDDFTPNSSDEPQFNSTSPQEVHVHVDVPSGVSTVHIHVHFGESSEPAAGRTSIAADPPSAPHREELAQGRALPHLMFVTNPSKLERRVGVEATTRAMRLVESAGHTLLRVGSFDEAITALRAHHDVKGVVLLGGYEVLPAKRVDVLSDRLRADRRLDPRDDEDQFIVWSDDPYGDLDGDGLPSVPVSRVPDGGDAATLLGALLGAPVGGAEKFGVRNAARPFANAIWQSIPGQLPLLASRPTEARHIRSANVNASLAYFMLHGSDRDTTRFWGEAGGEVLEAFNAALVPDTFGGVVFTGCCYGALIAQRRALETQGGVADLPADRSIALRFLRAGARAFVGCTGTHYSPGERQLAYGGPMHLAFMRRHLDERLAPAEALFHARGDYLAGIPYVDGDDVFDRAVERKIWSQFTCLGLGW
ncbi:hypothetical protein HNQ08_004853 [Deinococcus humi]|uniref:Metallo-beta-lactamase domain-containing protein n=1 Tax=Deinococcus humi TaxID=662880 RepID=A0A7W8JYU4_9DEIO|nr:hypothetical protein [Deinococcus humi]